MDEEWRKGFERGFAARLKRDASAHLRVVHCLAMMSIDRMRCRYASDAAVRAVQSEFDKYPRGFLAGWDSCLVKDL